ncbi:MAG: hypothetical protein KC417_13135 [Myxococcales bacterium]|nr:hypothetical protein [Myxococcales bacterium]
MKDVFDRDEVTSVLRNEFYRGKSGAKPPKKRRASAGAEHYTVICISLYNEDLERLDQKVEELKRSGHRKMTRSALIRFALDNVDVRKLPRSY